MPGRAEPGSFDARTAPPQARKPLPRRGTRANDPTPTQTEPTVMPQTALIDTSDRQSHNLLGQRLGRKGRDTRERVVAALHQLLATSPDVQPTLTAIAREAGVGMTTLYLYFSDLSELLLAALDPITREARLLIEQHCHRWSDDILHDECLTFLEAHYRFWAKHSRILHLRNSFADAGDPRLLANRRAMSNPAIECFAHQIGIDARQVETTGSEHAIVLLTMVERMATITTDANIGFAPVALHAGASDAFVLRLLEAEASIMALTIDGFRHGALGRRR
ncbi:TetR/AcrR family transcriptional regulator [uncultured Sphingomonas sp.]|uniref:TetR/AcrR family transcriptional regulator n=1 Tax=uncultured Sphingomonas sp. TaxID=158754 RepID=UPI0026084749|nr:TetR/AcrR family transcriptional regulator [uncultured Sphingomonas sp.]